MNRLSVALRQNWKTTPITLSKMMYSGNGPEIIAHEVNGKGILTLNRPGALNALSPSMIESMKKCLLSWQDRLSMVIVKGGPKAFCAGGDVRSVVAAIKDDKSDASQYFYEEYQLDYLTHTLKIPYVSFIHGIVMGGGFGISVHGDFRVATEATLFAMPETAIGLIPDVGGSYFLSRLKSNLGMYLALTGHRLRGSDVMHCGVATHYCDKNLLDGLEKELLELNDVSKKSISDILNAYESKAETKSNDFSLTPHLADINRIFGANTLEEMVEALRNNDTDWSRQQLDLLKKMSPLAMKVTLRQIREGGNLSLDKCLQMEYGIVRKFCEGTEFPEGVRALLIDKDNKPNWNPPCIENVTNDMVDEYFRPLPQKLQLTF